MSLNVISRDTMIVKDPKSFLRFLSNGTYVPILKVHTGRSGQEFFIPKVLDTTQNKTAAIRKVFPVGCELVELEYEGKISGEVRGVSDEFVDQWRQIEELFLQELVRQKKPILGEGEIPQIVDTACRAKILPGAESKLREAYSKYDAAVQSIQFTLNMVWFREKQTKEPVEASKMGIQHILGYPSEGPVVKFTKKRKAAIGADGTALEPGTYAVGTCAVVECSGDP